METRSRSKCTASAFPALHGGGPSGTPRGPARDASRSSPSSSTVARGGRARHLPDPAGRQDPTPQAPSRRRLRERDVEAPAEAPEGERKQAKRARHHAPQQVDAADNPPAGPTAQDMPAPAAPRTSYTSYTRLRRALCPAALLRLPEPTPRNNPAAKAEPGPQALALTQAVDTHADTLGARLHRATPAQRWRALRDALAPGTLGSLPHAQRLAVLAFRLAVFERLAPYISGRDALGVARDPRPLLDLQGPALEFGMKLHQGLMLHAYRSMARQALDPTTPRPADLVASLDELDTHRALPGQAGLKLERALKLRMAEFQIVARMSPEACRQQLLAHALRPCDLPEPGTEALQRAVALRGAQIEALYSLRSPQERKADLDYALSPLFGGMARPAQPQQAQLLRGELIRVLSKFLDEGERAAALAEARDPQTVLDLDPLLQLEAWAVKGLHLRALLQLMTPTQCEQALARALELPAAQEGAASRAVCDGYLRTKELGWLLERTPEFFTRTRQGLENVTALQPLALAAQAQALTLRGDQFEVLYGAMPPPRRAAELDRLRDPASLAGVPPQALDLTLELRVLQFRALYALQDAGACDQALAVANQALEDLQEADVDRRMPLLLQEIGALQALLEAEHARRLAAALQGEGSHRPEGRLMELAELAA